MAKSYKQYDLDFSFPVIDSIELSLKEVRTQFEKYHKQYKHPLDTYLDKRGVLCYTIYWIEAQWVGYQRMARDLRILKEIE